MSPGYRLFGLRGLGVTRVIRSYKKKIIEGKDKPHPAQLCWSCSMGFSYWILYRYRNSSEWWFVGMIKNLSPIDEAQILAPPFTTIEPQLDLCRLSGPLFPHLRNGDGHDGPHLMELLEIRKRQDTQHGAWNISDWDLLLLSVLLLLVVIVLLLALFISRISSSRSSRHSR